MKYITKPLIDTGSYVQYGENEEVKVLYQFEKNENTYILNEIVAWGQPEYFLLPNLKVENNKKFEASYILDCTIFKKFKKVRIVCPDLNLKIINNNYCDLNLILSKGKSLYGVIEKEKNLIPFNEPYGCLYIWNENFQSENFKKYVFRKYPKKQSVSVRKIYYGFGSAPQFDSNARIKIDRSITYNGETNSFEQTENYNENNIQNVFPDIEDDLTK